MKFRLDYRIDVGGALESRTPEALVEANGKNANLYLRQESHFKSEKRVKRECYF